jgi:hypothetical protein
MSALVTLTTFTNMLDANLAAGHLERAGIECYIQDENINNIYPNIGVANLIVSVGSSAYGGIKLQIKDDDGPKAIEVLKSNGYFNEENEKPSQFINSIDKITGKLPFLHQYPLQVKIPAIIFFALAVCIVIFVLKNNR